MIGKTLVRRTDRGVMAAVITETEAYLGVSDRASHAYGGRRTARTETMYLPGGFSYVYLIYGLYACLNLTAAEDGNPEAVLIRAAYPIEGRELIYQNVLAGNRRKKPLPPPESLGELDWFGFANGPGKLCLALSVTRADNALDCTGDALFLRDDGFQPKRILERERIGIDYAGEARFYPWRFTAAEENGLPAFDPAASSAEFAAVPLSK